MRTKKFVLQINLISGLLKQLSSREEFKGTVKMPVKIENVLKRKLNCQPGESLF
jgi:hypothetical protein